MIAGIEALACQDLAVPAEVMHHIVHVESSYNPYAIGVVGTRLARQPRNLAEAVATARQLERDGFNFSLGLAQVNLHNLARQGLGNYELAFDPCPNLEAGSRILAECHMRAGGDWDKAFSCYYSGNFTRGFRDGYVRKVRASIARDSAGASATAIQVVGTLSPRRTPASDQPAGRRGEDLAGRRGMPAAGPGAEGPPGSLPPTAWAEPPAAQPAAPAQAAPGEAFVPSVRSPASAGLSRADDIRPAAGRDSAFVF